MHNFLCVAIIVAACPCFASRLAAEQADSGRVEVTVEESMGMLAGFRVQAAGRTANTDPRGIARLTLPVGSHLITITRIGFKSSQVSVAVVRDSVISVKVTASMNDMAMEMEEVRISATRTERLGSETPIRVEVVDEMEVDEKTLMSPSGIAMLLNETPGLRVQASAPGLGTGSVRILGLPGQYTAMLADGLPLYGASASALGPLDISPVDLQRVEIIKGAASALYGGQALGGVINLVSKPPTGKKELLLNRRAMGVTDGAAWLSHRFGTAIGVSLLGAGTVQSAQDVDDDGWADQSRAKRWSVRPRMTAVDSHDRSLFLTAGYGYDDRVGGTVDAAHAPDGMPFREALRSDRADIGATARIPLQGSGSVALRFAVATSLRERAFGSGTREDDKNSTGFLELTRSFDAPKAATVLGAALQFDDFKNTLNSSYDHSWYTPGVFATTERDLGPLTLSASVRGDAHPDAGFRLTERLAVLAKPAEGWTVRGSVGTGYSAASARTEETEAMGLRAVRPADKLRPERSIVGMLDINGEFAGAEVLVTGYRTATAAAIQLAEVSGSGGQAILRNAGESTRVGGIEALALWRFSGGKFIGTYGHASTHRLGSLQNRLESHNDGVNALCPGGFRRSLPIASQLRIRWASPRTHCGRRHSLRDRATSWHIIAPRHSQMRLDSQTIDCRAPLTRD